jgi:hypothetical protein
VPDLTCIHGADREPHPWARPGCPEQPVVDLLTAANAAETNDDAPGIMAILLAAGGAGVSAKTRFRGGRR